MASSSRPRRRNSTTFTPIGRAGTAHEVAEAIVWLLSDKSAYVTGDFINVTGGAR